jgi:hypothetical protein
LESTLRLLGGEVYNIHPPKYSLRSDLGQLDELMVSIEEKGLLEP